MADARGRSVNAELLDRAIAHAIYFQRLKTSLVREIVALLNDEVLASIEAEILAEVLAAAGGESSLQFVRLIQIQSNIRSIAFSGFNIVRERLVTALEHVATYEAEWAVAAVRRALPPINVSFDAPSAATLRALVETSPFEGRVLNQWWTGIAADTQARISETVRTGIVEGRTTPEIVARLRDDTFPTTRRNADAVVRTASQEVATAARMQTYRENTDLVKGWKFVATLDARTTLICASEDGKVYALGEGRPPPLHFGCRSTTTPVLKSFAELGLPFKALPPGARSSLDGAVPASTTYDQWLRRQSHAVQDEALGTERASLFRAGKHIAEFVDDRGKTLTLAELRALDHN